MTYVESVKYLIENEKNANIITYNQIDIFFIYDICPFF